MRPKSFFNICLGICVSACSQPATESVETERLRNQVYFSKRDPGRWKDFAKDHEPSVKKISGDQIEIDVPLVADIGHYVEVIVATDATNKEIATKSFRRGERAHATLYIPPGKMAGASVIAKCNLHGMWRNDF